MYSQLYFRDANESCDAFSSRFENTTVRDLVCNLHMWIRENNEYARTYRTLREMVDGWRATGSEVPLYNIRFNQDKSLDHRTYNAPVAQTEVAGIFIGEPSKYDRERTLTVMHRFQANRENFSTVNCSCPQADPLCYPLLFPRGDLGYHYDMEPWHGPPPPPEPQPAAARAAR